VLNILESFMTPFEWTLIAAFLALLLIHTLVHYKLGFSSGTKGGYTVGMYHAVYYLMKNQALECENKDTGAPATAAEVVVHIIKSKEIVNMGNIKKEEMIKMVEASLEMEKE
jgi:hypothetical protein